LQFIRLIKKGEILEVGVDLSLYKRRDLLLDDIKKLLLKQTVCMDFFINLLLRQPLNFFLKDTGSFGARFFEARIVVKYCCQKTREMLRVSMHQFLLSDIPFKF
jgi:hypothetical protein